MSDSSRIIKAVKHYQQCMEKYIERDNEQKILHCLEKLNSMPILLQHLQETGVGRTVNDVRRTGGKKGHVAKILIAKWKEMVESLCNREPDASKKEKQKTSSSHKDSRKKEDVHEKIKDERKSRHEIDKHKAKKSSERQKQEEVVKQKSLKRKYEDDESDSDYEIKQQNSSEDGSRKRQKCDNTYSENEFVQDQTNSDYFSEDEENIEETDYGSSRNEKESYEEIVSSRKSKVKLESPQSNHKKRTHHSKDKVDSKHSKSETKKKLSSHSHKSHHREKTKKDSHHEKTSSKSSHKHIEKSATSKHESSKDVRKKDSSSSSSKSSHSTKHKKHSKDRKSKSSSSSNKSIKKTVDENGICSQSGASFAEALGMLEPTSSKNVIKKKATVATAINEVPSASWLEAESSSSVPTLLNNSKLEPLDINVSSLLPEITPNYRPLGSYLSDTALAKSKKMSESDALCAVITSKTQRTKVYSGNKCYYGKVSTLFDSCIRVLQDNIDALEYTGGVPYSILKPVLDRATADQLYMMEHHNPYLIEDTDELWQFHCQKDFRTKKREEMETWRDMYIRCLDEREAKLIALTANIKQAQDKSLPVRQTKLAYVDSVVKPPRNIARKQAKNGIEKKPFVTPSSRLNALATSGAAGQVSVPNPGARASTSSSGSSSCFKPKKAPLMQKTLAFIKNRKFRR